MCGDPVTARISAIAGLHAQEERGTPHVDPTRRFFSHDTDDGIIHLLQRGRTRDAPSFSCCTDPSSFEDVRAIFARFPIAINLSAQAYRASAQRTGGPKRFDLYVRQHASVIADFTKRGAWRT